MLWRLFLSSRDKNSIEARNRALYRMVSNLTNDSKDHIDSRLLDVGCGSGELSKYFAFNFAEVVLLDISMNALRKAKSSMPNSYCVCADAHFLPFRNDTFSRLHAFSLIEHLSHPKRFLREASRVLKEEGILIVQIPNPNFLIELHTGIILPFFIPRTVKDEIAKKAFPDLYVNWSLTGSILLRQLSKLFTKIKLYKYSYPEDSVSRIVRPLFRIAKRLKILNKFPMGYIIIAWNT